MANVFDNAPRNGISNKEQRQITRIPFVGNTYKQQNFDAEDAQEFVNCLFETSKDHETKEKQIFVNRRPGIIKHLDISEIGIPTVDTRGVWVLEDFDSIFFFVNQSLYYYDTVASTYSALITTNAGLEDNTPHSLIPIGTKKAFFCDGVDGWLLETTDGTDVTATNVERAYFHWTANTIYEVGDKVTPTAYNFSTATAYYYRVSAISNGLESKSGSSEPTWPTSIGDTVVDGDITWECYRSITPSEKAFKWTASAAYTVDRYVKPTVETGIYYKVTASDGAAGATEPTWPLAIGETVTQDGVTYEAWGYYGGFPGYHVKTPVFLDGYLILAEENSGDFYNSGINDVFSWSALDFGSAENFSDNIVALARHNNFLIVFGTRSTEIFYNAANEIGSPFSRNENYLLQVGLHKAHQIFEHEKYLIWVGASTMGRLSVWMLNGYEAREISTEIVERDIYSLSPENVFGFRLNGHILLMLRSLYYCWVYDVKEEIWSTWKTENELFPSWPFTSCSVSSGYVGVYKNKIYFQEYFTGDIYELAEYHAYDGTAEDPKLISMEFTIGKHDLGNNRRKFFHNVAVIGNIDLDTTSTPTGQGAFISWKDEGSDWSGPYQMSEYNSRIYYNRCGSSRRRLWKVQLLTTDFNVRVEALEVVYTQGRN